MEVLRREGLLGSLLLSGMVSMAGCVYQPESLTPEQIKTSCQGVQDQFKEKMVVYELPEETVSVIPYQSNIPPSNNRIALATRLEGGNLGFNRFLTADRSYDDSYPQISPDGQKVVFIRQGSIRVSPDHMVTHDYSNEQGIYIVNVDGSDKKKLISTPPRIYDRYPLFSPNGKEVIFVREIEGIRYPEIYLIDLASKRSIQLSRFYGAMDAVIWPTYSPDGRQIAYMDINSTYVMDINGKNVRKVSAGISPESPAGIDRGFRWFSSKQLIVTKQYNISYGEFRNRNFMVDVETGNMVDITALCPPPLSILENNPY